jgi:hypothetical protein
LYVETGAIVRVRKALLIGSAFAGLVALPIGGNADVGHAAYYSSGYGVGWWENTLALHESWGDAIAGAEPDPNGYYCVKPGYTPGERLTLYANGVGLVCTIGDTVQSYDVADWESQWVVELSWDTFTALGLDSNNVVEVYAGSDDPAPTEPEPAEPAAPEVRHFDETNHDVADPFLSYWDDNGGLPIFGYPETDQFLDTKTGLTMQYFERARMEVQPDGSIVLGRVGAEQIGK